MKKTSKRAMQYHQELIEANPQAEAWNFEAAYLQGAKDQLEEVCFWLKKHLPLYCDEFDETYAKVVIDDLKKSMET